MTEPSTDLFGAQPPGSTEASPSSGPTALDRVGAGFKAALGTLVRPVRALVHLWRRSIQARVVIGTLSLSAVLAILAGLVLLHRVADGLLASKQQSALSQAAAGVDTAQSTLDSSPIGNSFDVGQVLNPLVNVLSPRDVAHNDFYVAFTGTSNPVDENSASQGSRGSPDVNFGITVPGSLQTQVATHPGTWWAYSSVHFTDSGRPDEPGLVVGSQVRVPSTGQSFSLFYVFPLREQQQTLSVVRSAMITAGALLTVLLATIAWLVTRQVVTPVRLARRIAERLAAGRLEERMHVRGEDDIARLGTSFNQMAENLQRHIGRLEELSRMQRRFVADVSHELRTPLTTVRMAADVLYDARTAFDPVTGRSAELLQTQLDRFELLLTDLLEISRFDAGAAVLDLTDIDLRDAARSVVDSCSALAERRGTVVRLRMPSEPILLKGDVRRLGRIIRNLVVNAIDYGEGGDVDVTLGADTHAVALCVRDHGVGLRPGEEVLVFNRFWRADPARARTRGGTGLGLSIAVEDTTLHEGKLEAWGAPGVGSVFRLTLPRRPGGVFTASPLPLAPLTLKSPDPIAVGAAYSRYPLSAHRTLP
ncbi:MAG: MtrAB system histidine kinase MtrB [Nocardioidaceae bacterium]